MKTKNIYYTNLILNILAAIVTIITSIISLTQHDRVPSRIVFVCICAILIVGFVIMILKLRKSFFADPLWVRVVSICDSLLIVAYIVLLFTLKKHMVIFIIYCVTVAVSISSMVFVLLADDGKIRYNQVKRASTKTPTMTIQLSTEYLVKDYYTKEESEKTLKQLYSIHNSNGFSLEEYNKLREKILKNTQK